MIQYLIETHGPYFNVVARDPRPGRRAKVLGRFVDRADAEAFADLKRRQQLTLLMKGQTA